MRFDSISNNYSAQNRDYNVALQRWTKPDPIGFAGGDHNLSRIEDNNPLKYTDPSGEIAPIFIVALVVVVGTSLYQRHLAHRAEALARAHELAAARAGRIPQPEQQQFETELNGIQWQSAINSTAGLTAGGVATGPILGSIAATGTVGYFSVLTFAAGSVGFTGYDLATTNWGNLNTPQTVETIGNAAGPFVGGLGSGYYFRPRLGTPGNPYTTIDLIPEEPFDLGSIDRTGYPPATFNSEGGFIEPPEPPVP
jgi:RHS repeat-associated protein